MRNLHQGQPKRRNSREQNHQVNGVEDSRDADFFINTTV
jgi:hypothetical protein